MTEQAQHEATARDAARRIPLREEHHTGGHYGEEQWSTWHVDVERATEIILSALTAATAQQAERGECICDEDEIRLRMPDPRCDAGGGCKVIVALSAQLAQQAEELAANNAEVLQHQARVVVAEAQLAQQAEEIARLKALYGDLLYQVAKKHPGESRHDTAKRYIQQQEAGCACTRGVSANLLENTRTCEACDAGFRLASNGIHYDDSRGGWTWGVCRKVSSALSKGTRT